MIEPVAIAAILGLGAEIRTLHELDGAIARGLSKESVTRVVVRVSHDESAARVLRDQVVPLATWKRTKDRVSVVASARAERLARVLAAAEFVWDDAVQARAWVNTPHGELQGQTPLAAARTELGARAVEEVLDRLMFGLPV